MGILLSVEDYTKEVRCELRERQWYQLEAAEVAQQLNTDLENGLSNDIAQKRLEEYGYNELVGKKGLTIWQMLFNQFKDFLVLILIGSAVISAFVGEVADAAVILVIVILNAVLGVSQERRAGKALEALKQMAAPKAKVIRHGKQLDIPSRELVPGDLVILETGDYIPADVRLSESVNLKVEEASLTGESVPVEKNAVEVNDGEVTIGDRHNSGFMGTIVTYGRGKGLVIGTGMKTEIGQIAEMLDSFEEEETPLQRKLDEFGKLLGYICIAVVAVVFVLGLIRNEEPLHMFMTSVSLAVAAIPEGLPAIVTIVLALGMKRMISRNAIVKRLHAVESLGSITTICSDKTGTLTKNEMTVVAVHTGQKTYTVTGKGYAPEGQFIFNNQTIHPKEESDLSFLLKISLLNNDSRLEKDLDKNEDAWKLLGDPTEGSLLVASLKAGYTVNELTDAYPRVQEIPFDSDRKRMTTFHKHPEQNGHLAFVKGAPDMVLALCTKILKQGKVSPITEEDKKDIMNANSHMATQSLRVLSFAYREMDQLPESPEPETVEKDLIFVGLMGMIDPARPEAIEAIKVCKSAGIRPVMITGDYKDTAVAIAKELGIIEDDGAAMTGAEIDKLSEAELVKAVKKVNVFARVSPTHKVKIVEAVKANGEICSMTGDGVNDAPALKRADIGVAMGITGTDVAKETAEMILTDDNFASIVSAVEEGRVIYANIRKFVFFLLSCNVGEILIIFFAMLFGWPVPLEPIQLLWLNLVTDAFPALALGMEPAEPNIMRQPPRDPKASIIDRRMTWGIILQSIAMTVAVLGIFKYALIVYDGDLRIARTFAFVGLIVSELLRSYTARSEIFSIFKLGLFSNKYVVGGTLLSFFLMLIVLYVPALEGIFETVELSLSQWGVIIAFSLIPAAIAEITKLFLRRGEGNINRA